MTWTLFFVNKSLFLEPTNSHINKNKTLENMQLLYACLKPNECDYNEIRLVFNKTKKTVLPWCENSFKNKHVSFNLINLYIYLLKKYYNFNV